LHGPSVIHNARAVQTRDRHAGVPGAGGDQDMPGLYGLLAVRPPDGQEIRAGERGLPLDDLDSRPRQEQHHPANFLFDDGGHARLRLGPIQAWRFEHDAKARCLARLGIDLSGAHQGLRRDAALVQADPADAVPLDADHAGAQLRGAQRGYVAARPRSDDGNVRLYRHLSSGYDR